MDVDIQTDNSLDINIIINYLVLNKDIQFKSQQKDESDLTNEQKRDIALATFNRNKISFLNRFGNYLQKSHIEYFQSFVNASDEGIEMDLIVRNLLRLQSEEKRRCDSKNRRYEALKVLVANGTYFSENEMMKRNPLLYDQLIGQFMSEAERKERDNNLHVDTTLVKILMEGIERDDAKLLQIKQEEEEDDAMEEEDSEDEDSDTSSKTKPSTSQGNWGEFKDLNNDYQRKKNYFQKQRSLFVTATERQLLKEEFTTLMYRSFLDGKDDYDYDSIDRNEAYDNHDIVTTDAEEQYFDSEEPEEVNGDEAQIESSEDELDIYMNALNQHPSVCQLSEDISKL